MFDCLKKSNYEPWTIILQENFKEKMVDEACPKQQLYIFYKQKKFMKGHFFKGGHINLF
jgi:hypothetical protein